MFRMRITLSVACVLIFTGTAIAWQQNPNAQLKEADVLKLIELQPSDDVILGRLRSAKLGFAVDEAVLKRFREAGASQDVLAELSRRDRGAKQNATVVNTITYEKYESTEGYGAIELRGIPTKDNRLDDNVHILSASGKDAVLGGGKVGLKFCTYKLKPGNYIVNYYKVKGTELPVKVEAGKKAVIHFGGVAVKAQSAEHNAVYTPDQQLVSGYIHQVSPLAEYLLPGKYNVTLQGVSQQVSIVPGKMVELPTGSFTVNSGKALWVFRPVGAKEWHYARSSGKVVCVFPGKYEWETVLDGVKRSGLVDIKADKQIEVKAAKK